MNKIRCMGCMEELQDGQDTCPHCGYKVGTRSVEVFHLQPGTILANKYLVGKAVGYGGFGVTYIGYDTVLERRVAIKEYLPGEFATRVPGQEMVTIYEGEKHEQFDSGIEKFIDEAKRLGKFIDTDGIVHIYDSFLANATAYIVMEFIDGITLKEKISREGKLSLEESLNIIKPIINALKEVHKENILHRDIAPDNIMIGNDGKVSLIDFGASRFATTTYSKSLSVLIKPGYAPVEQYQSRGKQGPWSDVYSLAATFYTMLTGIAPQESIERGEQDLVKPPSKMGAKVNKSMDNAIMNALNLKVEERTPSMEKFEEELLSQKEVVRLITTKDKQDTGKWPLWIKITFGAASTVILGFLVLMVTGIITIKGQNWGTSSVQKVVPNLINKSQDDATTIAKTQNLKPFTEGGDYSDTIAYGMIMKQNPAPGTSADENSYVKLIYCKGPNPDSVVKLPKLEDFDKDAAVKKLTELGVQYSIVEKEAEGVHAGTVIGTEPEGGAEIKANTSVIIYVAKSTQLDDGDGNQTGQTDALEVIVEDLTGKDYDKAKAELQNQGIALAKSGQEYSMKYKVGEIISQDIAAGSTLLQGQGKIMVVVSLGDTKPIPRGVMNSQQTEAEVLLKKEGFQNIQVNKKYDDSTKGLVIGVSPNEGTAWKMGDSVVLTVSEGPEPSTQSNQAKNPQWSEWVETLPGNVNDSNYEINTKIQYSYRDKSTIESSDASLESQGYTLDAKTPVYSDYGAWSDWILRSPGSEVSASDLVDVGYETRYSHRDKVYTNNYYWGDWSAWQNEAVEASATREVDTQDIPATYKTQYNYSKYTEYANGNGWSGPSSGSWGGKYCSYYQETGWMDSPLAYKETQWNMGRYDLVVYDGYWYNEQTRQVEVTPAYTQYRYRDQKNNVTETWSNWSDYDLTPVTASDTREVNTQEYYRYRTRTLSYMYSYSKWSKWSEYSDKEEKNTGNREVRTRKLFQYKAK